MSMELGAMGPGAAGNGARTATAPRSALGPGVSLHAYDIGVLVVYFVFVLGVGIWVSPARGRRPEARLAGEAESCSHLRLLSQGQAGLSREGQGSAGVGVEGPSGNSGTKPSFPGAADRSPERGVTCLRSHSEPEQARPEPSPDSLPHPFPLHHAETPGSADA